MIATLLCVYSTHDVQKFNCCQQRREEKARMSLYTHRKVSLNFENFYPCLTKEKLKTKC